MAARIRVAYIGIKGLPSKGGAERVVENILRVGSTDIDGIVYCARDYAERNASVSGVKLVCVPTLHGKHLKPLSLLLSSTIHALLSSGIDVVHLHNVESSVVAPLLRLRYPVLATAHGLAYERAKWGPVARRLMRMADYFYLMASTTCTSVSKATADLFQARSKKRVHYIPNGVELSPEIDERKAADVLMAHGIRSDYVVFVAGRLDQTKGCHLLIDAYAGQPSELQLLIVGDFTTMPEYSMQLRESADARVVFVPFVKSKSVVLGLMKRARLLVFPSTVEAMSMVLLEAAGLGTPVVCSDIAENREVLRENAEYFKSGDATALEAALVWALANPEEMRLRAARARIELRERFSWEKIVAAYVSHYKQLRSR